MPLRLVSSGGLGGTFVMVISRGSTDNLLGQESAELGREVSLVHHPAVDVPVIPVQVHDGILLLRVGGPTGVVSGIDPAVNRDNQLANILRLPLIPKDCFGSPGPEQSIALQVGRDLASTAVLQFEGSQQRVQGMLDEHDVIPAIGAPGAYSVGHVEDPLDIGLVAEVHYTCH